eukprot:GEMP01077535.1.p1 GENE.GEMP01077535.1~~GEMP01077535.1.p1  ORF type:complete len:100 (+),score=16.16 GEMP01077535.1:2-301(+)
MFSALLSLLQLEGYYNSSRMKDRRLNMKSFDANWLDNMKRMGVPTPFIKFWEETYNPVLEDRSEWQARPKYEMLIRLFQQELDSIRPRSVVDERMHHIL